MARAAAELEERGKAVTSRALAEAAHVSREHRTGHFWGMRESLRLEDCAMLLVVGTPAVRALAGGAAGARLLSRGRERLIDETSVRGEDGVWRYRDPRDASRVANALIRAELTRVCPPQPATAL